MTPCRWLERDASGRPRCEHGWAHKAHAGRWRCPLKAAHNDARYRATAKGRESRRKTNAQPATKSRKQLYELTRIR